MDWRFLVFLFFASLTCGFALATLLAQNVVRMAFFLILSLGASSGLFFLAGAEFVGAMQLMIYVGGTLVLLVFGVMLTASDAAIAMRSSAADWTMAAIPSAALFALLASSVLTVPRWNATPPAPSPEFVAEANDQTARLGLAFLGLRLEAGDKEATIGLPSGYLFPFEIVSIHLLVALIGAGYLARAKRRAVVALPDSIVAGPSPAWYAIAMNALFVLACMKVAAYLLAPGWTEQATLYFMTPGMREELLAAPDWWMVPSAAAVAIFAAGIAMLRFRAGAGLAVQAIGIGIAAAQFWHWGATSIATTTAAAGVAWTVLLAVAYLASGSARRPTTREALS